MLCLFANKTGLFLESKIMENVRTQSTMLSGGMRYGVVIGD